MDGYTQEDMTLLMNHINSTKRKGLKWKSPMELVEQDDEAEERLTCSLSFNQDTITNRPFEKMNL